MFFRGGSGDRGLPGETKRAVLDSILTMAGEGKRRTRRGKRKRHSHNNASPSLQKEEQPSISPPLHSSRPPKRSRVEPSAPKSTASSSFLDKVGFLNSSAAELGFHFLKVLDVDLNSFIFGIN